MNDRLPVISLALYDAKCAECERLKEDYRLKAEQHARLAEICEGHERKIAKLEQRIEAAIEHGYAWAADDLSHKVVIGLPISEAWLRERTDAAVARWKAANHD